MTSARASVKRADFRVFYGKSSSSAPFNMIFLALCWCLHPLQINTFNKSCRYQQIN